jgi:hypothetical protein
MVCQDLFFKKDTVMNLFSRITRAALAIALTLSLFACGNNDDAKAGDSAGSAAVDDAPAASPGAASDDAAANERPSGARLGDKLNIYVECYNQLNPSANKSMARYAQWVKNMETGPTGDEKVVYGLYDIRAEEVGACQKKMAQAADLKPALADLDAAGKTYIATLAALTQTVNEAHPYYARENYKDDAFAKGRALHPELVKRAQAFGEASTAFSDALEAENDKALAAQLAAVEKAEGRKATYWKMSLMLQAKQLVNILAREEFPVDAATKKVADFENVADATIAFAKANKEGLPTSWWTLENAAEDFRKAAKSRLRRIRDKTPYSTGEQQNLSSSSSAWMVDGSAAQVVRVYNELVENSNNLH